MSTKDNTALAGLRTRYDELRAEKTALHEAKPIDWDAVAIVEDKLADLMDELSKAVWSHDTFFGSVAIDARAGFRAGAYQSRDLARLTGGDR